MQLSNNQIWPYGIVPIIALKTVLNIARFKIMADTYTKIINKKQS